MVWTVWWSVTVKGQAGVRVSAGKGVCKGWECRGVIDGVMGVS